MTRTASLCLVAITGMTVAALTPSSGKADGWRWCSEYGGEMSGSSNCGFATYEQCMLNVSGIGGYCKLNPFYTGPSAEEAASRDLQQRRVNEKKPNG